MVGLKTPEGAALGEVRNQTFKTVRNWFLGKADTFGIPDPDGEESYTHAMALMNQAEEQGRKAGIPAADLYDPANKNWIGNSARGLVKNLDERTAALNAKLGGENKGPPPVKDRVLNQIYVSPNGPMKWTGTGWLKVTAPAVPTGD